MVEPISRDSSLFSVRSMEISPDFNLNAGVNGLRPAVQLAYGKETQSGWQVSADVTATLGKGVETGASAMKEWTVPKGENHLNIRAGVSAVATPGDVSLRAGVRADYIRAEGLSPYFTATASMTNGMDLALGAGACNEVSVGRFSDAILCAGVEVQGGSVSPGVSFGRRF